MPSSLNAEAIYKAQQEEHVSSDEGLSTTSLLLQPLVIDNFRILSDISTGAVRPYIPQQLRRKAFNATHAPAHPSGRVTSRMLKEKFVWPGIKRDALRWARECTDCQRAKIHRHNRLKPANIDVPEQRFNHVYLDLIILPVVEGYRYCLTMIDSRDGGVCILQRMDRSLRHATNHHNIPRGAV